jgi:hypothetical protein
VEHPDGTAELHDWPVDQLACGEKDAASREWGSFGTSAKLVFSNQSGCCSSGQPADASAAARWQSASDSASSEDSAARNRAQRTLEAPLEQSLVLEDLLAGHGHEALGGALISGRSSTRGLSEDAEPRSAGAKGRQGSCSRALSWHIGQAGGRAAGDDPVAADGAAELCPPRPGVGLAEARSIMRHDPVEARVRDSVRERRRPPAMVASGLFPRPSSNPRAALTERSRIRGPCQG